MWLVVARKRLPTPLRTNKPNPTVIVLPVLGTDAAEQLAAAVELAADLVDAPQDVGDG